MPGRHRPAGAPREPPSPVEGRLLLRRRSTTARRCVAALTTLTDHEPGSDRRDAPQASNALTRQIAVSPPPRLPLGCKGLDPRSRTANSLAGQPSARAGARRSGGATVLAVLTRVGRGSRHPPAPQEPTLRRPSPLQPVGEAGAVICGSSPVQTARSSMFRTSPLRASRSKARTAAIRMIQGSWALKDRRIGSCDSNISFSWRPAPVATRGINAALPARAWQRTGNPAGGPWLPHDAARRSRPFPPRDHSREARTRHGRGTRRRTPPGGSGRRCGPDGMSRPCIRKGIGHRRRAART